MPHSLHSMILQITSGPWLYWIVLGLIAGWAAGRLVRGAGFGIIFDVVLGMVGAVVGGFIFSWLGFSASGGFFYSLTVAIIGAVILVATSRLLTGRRV
jgi:uncharacterized membrane protein YeaQ/YmgE (transglycosylase-associated protein family)